MRAPSTRRRLLALCITGLFLWLGVSACGQTRLDAAGVGRGGASAATSRGIPAIYSNPGNLALQPLRQWALRHVLQVSLFNVGGVLGSTFLNSSDLERIFGRDAGWPTATDRIRLGSLLDGERLVGNAANATFALRWQNGDLALGLHYSHRIFSRIDFPVAFTKLLIDNELFNQRYEFVTQHIGADWVTECGLTAATVVHANAPWFPTVGLGVTAKLVNGIAHFGVGGNSLLTVERATTAGGFGYRIRGGYSIRSASTDNLDPAKSIGRFLSGLFPSGAGAGASVDVGVGGILYQDDSDPHGSSPHTITFGLVLSDLGSVRWNTNTTLRHQENIDDVIANGILTNEDFSRYQGVLDTIGAFTTDLPAAVRAGIACDLACLGIHAKIPVVVEVEGELPLNDVAGNLSDPRLSVGADIGVSSVVTARAGLSGWGIDGFGVGIGVGLNATDWLAVDLGIGELDGLISGERFDLAFLLSLGLGDL